MTRIAVLREVAERVERAAEERCAEMRTRRGDGTWAYCEGYHERGLRCPECPRDSWALDVVPDMIDEIETHRDHADGPLPEGEP